MKKTSLIRLLVVMLLFSFLTTACQGEPTEPPEVPDEIIVEDHNPGDSLPLRLAMTRPHQLNPLLNANDSLFQVNHLIYESLLTFDENMDVVPLLAESWDIDESGSQVTFHLRPNVTWHDGEPLRPEDVVFTFQVLRNKISGLNDSHVYAANVRQVNDVRKSGDRSVTFTFARPYSNALEILVFPILPQHLFISATAPLLDSMDFPIVGTGRFQLEHFDVSRGMTLRYYPSYWGRKPYIAQVDITIVPDKAAKVTLFENGKIDLVEMAAADWLKYTDNEQVNGIGFSSTYYEFIGFNLRNEQFQNKALRQAIDKAIQKQTILNAVYFGHGKISRSPIHPDSWLHKSGDDELEAAGVLTEIFVGETIRLLTNENNPLRVRTAEMIMDNLEELGLSVELELVSWDEKQARLASGNFDMVLAGWHFSLVPDLSFAFHSTQQSMGNFIGYSNEEMDSLLEAASGANTRESKREAWHAIQAHLEKELPYVSLFFKDKALLYRTTLRGDLSPTQHNIFRGIETAYRIRP